MLKNKNLYFYIGIIAIALIALIIINAVVFHVTVVTPMESACAQYDDWGVDYPDDMPSGVRYLWTWKLRDVGDFYCTAHTKVWHTGLPDWALD